MFTGRMNRRNFFIGLMPLIAVFIGGYLLSYEVTTPGGAIDSSVSDLLIIVLSSISLGLLLYSISIHTRRFHDLGMSGWWQILTIFAGVSFVLELLPRQKTTNEYGPTTA